MAIGSDSQGGGDALTVSATLLSDSYPTSLRPPIRMLCQGVTYLHLPQPRTQKGTLAPALLSQPGEHTPQILTTHPTIYFICTLFSLHVYSVPGNRYHHLMALDSSFLWVNVKDSSRSAFVFFLLVHYLSNQGTF